MIKRVSMALIVFCLSLIGSAYLSGANAMQAAYGCEMFGDDCTSDAACIKIKEMGVGCSSLTCSLGTPINCTQK